MLLACVRLEVRFVAFLTPFNANRISLNNNLASFFDGKEKCWHGCHQCVKIQAKVFDSFANAILVVLVKGVGLLCNY